MRKQVVVYDLSSYILCIYILGDRISWDGISLEASEKGVLGVFRSYFIIDIF